MGQDKSKEKPKPTWYVVAIKLGYGQWFIGKARDPEKYCHDLKYKKGNRVTNLYGVLKIAWSQEIPANYQGRPGAYVNEITIKAAKKYGVHRVNGGFYALPDIWNRELLKKQVAKLTQPEKNYQPISIKQYFNS